MRNASNISRARVVALVSGLACAGFAVDGVRAHELLLGRSAADHIVLHIEGEMPFLLGESIFPGLDGYAEANPGFVSTDEDLPDEGLFLLPGTCDLEFILLAATAHIQVWNDRGSAPMVIGETYHIGVPLFHNHPVWHSPDGVGGEVYTLTIRLRDRAAVLSDSIDYVLEFGVNEPLSPGDLDLDGDVDISDLAALLASFGLCFGDPGFFANADVDGDLCVGLGDLTILLAHFGE